MSQAPTQPPSTVNNDFVFSPAVRKALALKIILSGPSGSGKSLSSLALAAGLIDVPPNEAAARERTYASTWEDVAVVDAENNSALYYTQTSHDQKDAGLLEIGAFTHVPFLPPYHPQRWCRVIDMCVAKKKKVIVLDGGSYEWNGVGGCLDWHRDLGGQAQHWKVVSPAHTDFINKIRYCPIPIIVCLRENTEVVIEKVVDQSGREKTTVRKVGLKPQQRDGFDYEVDIHLSIDQQTHAATATKDRTGLLQPMPPAVITTETGRLLANWAACGAEPVGSRGWVASRCAELRRAATVDELVALFTLTTKQVAGLLTEEYRTMLMAAKDEAKARLMGGAK